MTIRELLERRAVLVTGKGGVGKTSVAAGLAYLAASLGKRVLVGEVSYEPDATSPLARALGIEKLLEEPLHVTTNLRAVLLTPTEGHVRFLRDTLPMRVLADAAMKAAAIRRFLLAAPTLAEMGILYRILDLVREKRHDGTPAHEVIVIDLPATGHTLGLAQIPTAILSVIHSGPIATAVREGLELLQDPAKTTSLVVTLPETLPVSEAAELVHGLKRHGIPFSGVVLNRMVWDPFTEEERSAVDELVVGKPMLGVRTLPRIDRAKAAVARLRSLSLPVAFVGEISNEGPVAAHIAETLGGLS
jgi:anion-transporting  ArsA/GET3 family ATPase